MSMNRRKLLMALAIVSLSALHAAACGSDHDNGGSGEYVPSEEDLQFINSVPDADSLLMSIPSASDQDSEAKLLAKVGETSQYYLVTRKCMHELNFGLNSMLSIIEEVLELPPTETTAETRIWQAEQPLSGMDSFVPRFRMNRLDASSFYYMYEWRPKDEPEGWIKIWWGEIVPDESAIHRVKGEMHFDFDTAAEIDSSISERGMLDIEFDTRTTNGRSIKVSLTDFTSQTDDDSPASGTYGFSETPELEGSFSFDIESNWAPESYEYENLAVETRWQSDGTGQSQVVITGDGIDIDHSGLEMIEVRECWNGSFKETYGVSIYHFEKGSEADDLGQNPFYSEEEGNARTCPFSFESMAD